MNHIIKINNIDLLLDQSSKLNLESNTSHFFAQKISCLALFPQNSVTPLINRDIKFKTLQLMDFFISEIIETLKSFHTEKKLTEFDPHVGDTLCQIRAYQNLLIFQHSTKNKLPNCSKFELMNLNTVQDTIRQCLHFFTELKELKGSYYNKVLDKVEVLEDFIKNHHLNFNLSKELFLLIQSRLLALFSIVDSNGISRGIDYKNFCLKTNLSKSFAKKLMHYFQKNISIISCEFVFKILEELNSDYFKT